jgi:glycosyltransferase involved in cell wall biosynthesis
LRSCDGSNGMVCCKQMRMDKFALKQPINKLSVLIAAYNEVTTIVPAIEALMPVLRSLKCEFEVIVVESNSTDGTRELLQKNTQNFGINLFMQESPKGKGSAIRLAMENMSGDVFLIYDADTEYSASDIPKLLEPIESGLTSFVLGTRHEKGRAMRVMDEHRFTPALMNLAHRFFTTVINFSFFVRLTDPFTMYKIFRSEVFKDIELVSNRFDFDWELVCKAIRLGCTPIELPVFYKSRSFSEGKKVRFIRDPLTWIIALIKFRFGRVIRNPNS